MARHKKVHTEKRTTEELTADNKEATNADEVINALVFLVIKLNKLKKNVERGQTTRNQMMRITMTSMSMKMVIDLRRAND